MQDNNILDDIDIDSNQGEFTGTTNQLLRGLFLAASIQFLLWILFFKLIDLIEDDLSGLIDDSSLLDIAAINYSLNFPIILVFLVLLTGTGSFVLLSNAKNQMYRRILPMGLLFAINSILGLSIWRGIQEGEVWYSLFIRFYGVSLILIFFQFVLLMGLVFLMKRKWTILTILIIIGVFLGMGFIN